MVNRRSVDACSIILSAALLAGCSGSPHDGEKSLAGASSARPPALTPATFAGPLTQELRYPKAGFDLRPPGARTASTTWTQAYETCLTGDSICDPTVGPTITLALVTDLDSGQAQPDGSIRPLLDDTLSYVLTYTGVPCRPTGGSDPTSRKNVSPDPVTCTVLNFVSAADAKVLYSFQGPEP
jgi:hypothetical protein